MIRRKNQKISKIGQFGRKKYLVSTGFTIQGKVIVETDIETVEIGEGDFVTFPKGLKSVWDIKENIKKHYKFE